MSVMYRYLQMCSKSQAGEKFESKARFQLECAGLRSYTGLWLCCYFLFFKQHSSQVVPIAEKVVFLWTSLLQPQPAKWNTMLFIAHELKNAGVRATYCQDSPSSFNHDESIDTLSSPDVNGVKVTFGVLKPPQQCNKNLQLGREF